MPVRHCILAIINFIGLRSRGQFFHVPIGEKPPGQLRQKFRFFVRQVVFHVPGREDLQRVGHTEGQVQGDVPIPEQGERGLHWSVHDVGHLLPCVVHEI